MDATELVGMLVKSCLGDGQDGNDWSASLEVACARNLFPDSLMWVADCLEHMATEKVPVSVGSFAHVIRFAGVEVGMKVAVDYLWSLDAVPAQRGLHDVWIKELRSLREREHAVEILEESARAIKSGELAPSDVKLDLGEDVVSADDSGDFYANLQTRLETFWEGGAGQFIPTPWPTLNIKMGGGWRRGGLNFIVARPGKGKTAVVEQDAEFQSQRGLSVMYCAIEMEPEDHIARILRRHCYDDLCRVGALDFEGIRLSKKQREVVVSCLERVKSMGIRFLSCRDPSVQAIFSSLNREWARKPFDILVMDYFQLVRFTGIQNHSSANLEALQRSLQVIMSWSRKNNVAVLLPAQAKRELDDLTIVPTKSHISDCSEAEKLASNVVFCHAGRFVVAKARRGVEGIIDVEWDGPRLSFREKQGDLPFDIL